MFYTKIWCALQVELDSKNTKDSSKKESFLKSF